MADNGMTREEMLVALKALGSSMERPKHVATISRKNHLFGRVEGLILLGVLIALGIGFGFH